MQNKLQTNTKADLSQGNHHIQESLNKLDVLTKSEENESQEKEKDNKKSILNAEMMGLNKPEHALEQLKEFGKLFSH